MNSGDSSESDEEESEEAESVTITPPIVICWVLMVMVMLLLLFFFYSPVGKSATCILFQVCGNLRKIIVKWVSISCVAYLSFSKFPMGLIAEHHIMHQYLVFRVRFRIRVKVTCVVGYSAILQCIQQRQKQTDYDEMKEEFA